jgi:hypothetical protein
LARDIAIERRELAAADLRGERVGGAAIAQPYRAEEADRHHACKRECERAAMRAQPANEELAQRVRARQQELAGIEPSELFGHLLRGGKPLLLLARDRPFGDRAQILRRLAREHAQRCRWFLQRRCDQRVRIVLGGIPIWRLAGQHGVEDRAECIDIVGRIDGLAGGLCRRHVARRADHRADLGEVRIA